MTTSIFLEKIITIPLNIVSKCPQFHFSAYFCDTIIDKVYGNRTYIDSR